MRVLVGGVLLVVAMQGAGIGEGIRTDRVQSPYQPGATEIRVLQPDRVEAGRRYRALYVLPVEAGTESRYGDGLLEVQRANLHNRLGLVCVEPRFAQLPWYADHPTDPGLRQESHLLRAVLPAVERKYPVLAAPEGRLLVGFSKSGWGAYSLLLRNPDVFCAAAAWDAPLEETSPQRFGMGPIFGTQENFERYRIATLLQRRAELLRGHTRLVLMGYGNFQAATEAAHLRLAGLGIAHVYRGGPWREHVWGSGWLPEAVRLLAGLKSPK